MIVFIILFILSLATLVVASDWFIDSAEKIGLSFGISPFIIGVTIVAFGTSLPELATSIASVFSGSSEIVIGNVIGSNITNILLVLGLTAIIGKEIVLDFDIMDLDMPLLFASTFLMYFAVSDQNFTLFEAGLFILGLVIFLYNSLKNKRDHEFERPRVDIKNYLVLLFGGILVYFSANYTIVAIEEISAMAGIDPEFIALSAVALGTSLPEVVVSISAARRGRHAIAVGNVLGSNIFNTYAVLGIPRFIDTLTIPSGIISFSLPFMIMVTIIFGAICFSRKISKIEGTMLLIFYLFFIGELFSGGIS